MTTIHSHPSTGDAQLDLTNRYPSDNPGAAGDNQTVDALVGHDSRSAPADEFTQYILGPDGVLREFNLANDHITKENDNNPCSRSDLTADRKCC